MKKHSETSIRKSAPKLGICKESYRKALHLLEFSPCKIQWRFNLDKNLKDRRINWARAHENRDWGDVIFSGESVFVLSFLSKILLPKDEFAEEQQGA